MWRRRESFVINGLDRRIVGISEPSSEHEDVSAPNRGNQLVVISGEVAPHGAYHAKRLGISQLGRIRRLGSAVAQVVIRRSVRVVASVFVFRNQQNVRERVGQPLEYLRIIDHRRFQHRVGVDVEKGRAPARLGIANFGRHHGKGIGRLDHRQ